MNLARILLGAALCVPAAFAQGSFELPTRILVPQRNNFPLGGPAMRYQQWFSAVEWLSQAQKPVRVTGMALKAAFDARGQPGRQVELEVTMANSVPTSVALSSDFNGNMTSGRTIVFPRQRVMVANATPGSYPLNLTFSQEFVWDGVSGVLFDLRLYDNGNNGQTYEFDFEFNHSSGFGIARAYTAGNPNAGSSTFGPAAGQGVTTQFRFNEALSIPYSAGCPGAGGHVPAISAENGPPIPGNQSWQIVVESAASQRTAVLFMGGSRTQWGSNSLPFDTGQLGFPGCSIVAEPLAFSPGVSTVGGGAGAGRGVLPFPLPARTDYLGVFFFAQWVVIDPLAQNGAFAMSDGLWIIPALQ